jgi:hypothetical protein
LACNAVSQKLAGVPGNVDAAGVGSKSSGLVVAQTVLVAIFR